MAYVTQQTEAPRLRWLEAAVVFCIAIAIGLLAIEVAEILPKVEIKEHSAIENMQITMLAVAAIVFCFARRAAPSSGERTVATACAIVMITGIVRELDVKTWDGPWFWNWLGDHGLQEILMVGGGVTALGYLFVNRADWRTVFARSFELAAWPFYLGCIGVFIGAFAFDRRLGHLEHAIAYEEFFEFVGYAFFAIAAIHTYRRATATALSTAES
ncbi:MAG: hypothetical protein AAFQ45_02430 [Pseudomonadota bacterium]